MNIYVGEKYNDFEIENYHGISCLFISGNVARIREKIVKYQLWNFLWFVFWITYELQMDCINCEYMRIEEWKICGCAVSNLYSIID